MEHVKMDEEKYENVIKIIKETAKRISDSDYVKNVESEESNIVFIDGRRVDLWSDISLADGYPALCMLYGELSNIFPEEGWDLIGHNYMIKMRDVIEKQSIYSSSLFGGLSSIGMAAKSLSFNGKRYQKFSMNINNHIIEHIPAEIEKLRFSQKYTKMTDYDVIEGFSGIGRYLLILKNNTKVKDTLEDIIKYMISLTDDIEVFECCVPNWYISNENQFIDGDKKKYTKGNFNFGMAHGIAGVLAFMSIALLEGIEVKGQREAVRKIVETINSFKYICKDSICWPGRIKFEEFVNKNCVKEMDRASWCYGVPGIARAIYLAGKALNNQEYKDLAIKSLTSLLSLPEQLWMLNSPTFCHGYSGLLRVIQCMYQDTNLPIFKEYSYKILDKVLEFYDKDAPFNFFNVEYIDFKVGDKFKNYNSCGLLGGSAGIILSILGTIYPSKTNWDSVFLIN